MATSLATHRLQQAYTKWNDCGRLASVPAIQELSDISSQCVEVHRGYHRILAYVLNRLFFALLDYWKDENTLDPKPFFEHGHQAISDAINVLQNDNAQINTIEPVIQQLIDSHNRLLE